MGRLSVALILIATLARAELPQQAFADMLRFAMSGPPVRGYTLWIDASQLVYLSDGTTVESIPEEVSGNRLTAGAAATYPTYRRSGINGRPSLWFDGTNDYLRFGTPAYNVTSSVFFVFSAAFADPVGFIFSQYQLSATGRDAATLNQNSAGSRVAGRLNWFNASVSSGSGSSSLLADGAYTDTGTIVWRTGTAGAENLDYYINSTAIDSATYTTVLQTNLILGTGAHFANYARFYFGEMIVYPTVVTTNESATILNYLRAKWGTP